MHLENPCPGCGHLTPATLSDIDRVKHCPRCDTEFTVPEPGQPVTRYTISERAKLLAQEAALAAAENHRPEPSSEHPPSPARPLIEDRGIRTVSTLFQMLAGLILVHVLVLLSIRLFLIEKPEPLVTSSSRNAGPAESVLQDFQRTTDLTYTVTRFLSAVFTLLLAVQAGLCWFTGRWLRRGEHYQWCIAGAAVTCLHVPLGTALGIVTIVMLREERIQNQFDNPGEAVLTYSNVT